MKKAMRILSVFMAGVLAVTTMFFGSVTAGALSIDQSPLRFYWEEKDGSYILYIDGFDEAIAPLEKDQTKPSGFYYISRSAYINLNKDEQKSAYTVHVSDVDSSYSGKNLEAKVTEYGSETEIPATVKHYEKDGKKLKGGFAVTVTDKKAVTDLKTIKSIGYNSIDYYGSDYRSDHWSNAVLLPISKADSTKNPNEGKDTDYTAPDISFVENGDYIGFKLVVDHRAVDLVTELQSAGYEPDFKCHVNVFDYIIYLENDGKEMYFGVVTDEEKPKSVKVDKREYYTTYYEYTSIAWFKKTSDIGKELLTKTGIRTANMTYYLTGRDRNFYGSLSGTTMQFVSLATAKYLKDLKIKQVENGGVENGLNDKYTKTILHPKLSITDGDKELTPNVDYDFSFDSSFNIGECKVKIVGKGNYLGYVEKTFKFGPMPPTLTVKRSGNKYKLSWNAVADAEKYEIRYSTDGGKTFKKACTVASDKTSKTLKLSKNKSYIFRIRTYKTIDGKKYYSAWNECK